MREVAELEKLFDNMFNSYEGFNEQYRILSTFTKKNFHKDNSHIKKIDDAINILRKEYLEIENNVIDRAYEIFINCVKRIY